MNANTLSDRLDEYIALLRARNYSPATLDKITASVTPFLLWLRGVHEVETPELLRLEHLEAWQRRLANRRTRKGMPLKPSTINVRIVSVRGYLRHLAGRGFVLKTLLDALEPVKLPRRLPESVLDHAQVKKLIKRIDTSNPIGYRNRALLELLYTSGLRAKEILSLDTGDIDFRQHTALVHGKGGKDRIVPIGRTALRVLESYIVAVRPFLVPAPGERALFLTKQGGRCGYHIIKNWLNRYTTGLDLDVRVTSHTFRRSCATEMIRAGANIYHVKELLGHESLDTLRHYTRLTINDLKATHQKCHPREKDEPR